jgi:hypothetical protein
MKKITLLFTVFLVAFTLKTEAQDLNISFESTEGFTLGEINGQNGWVANPTYSPFVNIVDTQSTDGSNSLYFETDPNGPVPNNGITGAVSPTLSFNDVTFTVDLFVESGLNPSEFDVILQSVASNALTSRVVFFDGDILVVDAVPTPQFVSAGTYTPDVWLELKIVHDFVNGVIEYSIDNAVVYTGNIVNGTSIDQMLLFSSFNQTGIYVDNVNFTTTTMSVEEFNNINLEIFPNPTTDILNIRTNNIFEINNISIYDMSGKKLEANLDSNNSVKVDHLSSGTYILVVDTNKGSQTERFIKK